jgi:iron(III) transport system permease protein
MKRSGLLLPVIVVAAFLGAYVLYPVAQMLLSSLTDGKHVSFHHYFALLDPSNSANLEAVVNSVGVSLLSVILSGIVGVFLAFVFTQFDFPTRAILSRFAAVPIALPPLVGVIAFLFVFGESGILPRTFSLLTGIAPGVIALEGIPAIVAIHVYSFNVYFYLLTSAALRRIDGSILEAAAVLGSGSWRTFRRLILPQLRPALLAASVLTFMGSMASFSAPYIFGGARRFLTVQIFTTKLNGDVDLAAAQSIMLMIVSISFFVVLTLLTGRGGGAMATKGSTRPGRLPVGPSVRATMVVLLLLLLVLEILPLLVIFLVSCAREGAWTWQILPAEYTVQNYATLFRDPGAFAPILNSIEMALLTVVGAIIVGFAGASLVTRGGIRKGRVLIDTIITLPYAIPGTVIALALIMAFNSPAAPAGYQTLVGTFWILPLAYVIRTYPLVHRSAASALAQLDPSLTEAAGTLGAGRWRQWRTIVIPIILPAVVSGALLVTIAALGEFVSSVLLYTYSSRPISVEILAQLRNFNFGAAAAYSVILLLLTLVLITFAGRLTDRSTLPVN